MAYYRTEMYLEGSQEPRVDTFSTAYERDCFVAPFEALFS